MKEERFVCYDKTLGIEAYQFRGIMQKFPNHFHEYYVIGFIEKGRRHLSCKNKDYTVNTGDMLLFDPLLNHSCEQIDNETLDYRCLNITAEVMQEVMLELTGRPELPHFEQPVIYQDEQVALVQSLHQMIMADQDALGREELFLVMMEQLVTEFAQIAAADSEDIIQQEVKDISIYIENNYSRHITLEELASLSNMNKYTMIRIYTKIKGITPYRYLQTVRVNRAKKLLEQGIAPMDAALQTGFVDQSHFSNFFKDFIGLTPKQYQDIFIQ